VWTLLYEAKSRGLINCTVSFILGLFQEFRAKWQLSNLRWHFRSLRLDQAVFVYVSLILRSSADCFLAQHLLISFCNGEGVCFQRGRN
jgi:hypothetical protein